MRNIEEYNRAVAELAEKVKNQTTVVQSAIALIQGLRARINQLIVDSDGIVATGELQKLSSSIDVGTRALADAVVANTSAPTTPSEVPVNEGTALTGGEGDPNAPKQPEPAQE